MIKNFIAGCMAVLCLASGAQANEAGAPWDKFPTDRVTDTAALQHGAKLFVNYCLNCHSAAYMRYNRLRDIGLTNDEIKKNLLFATDRVGDTMKAAIDPKDAKAWFGKNPPDLSVIARSRAGAQGSGADYLYTYLRSFYPDASRPTGWNNTAYPNVGMPHVMWQLQGEQKPVYEEVEDPHEHGKTMHLFKGFETVSKGSLNREEFNQSTADLVAYLQWMGEPAQTQRKRLGVWVLLFLGLFTVITWRLNAAYWKDIK